MASEEPMEKLKTLRITSLDDDENEDEVPIGLNGSLNGSVNLTLHDDEDDDEDEDQVSVVLGFVEKPKNKWTLLRQLFPSKAGGAPAWLDPVNLPNNASCCCDLCGEPLQFVLQIYAPLTEEESGKTTTFHRTLYMFMCNSMTCLLRDQHEQWKRNPEKVMRSVKVFRCQLSQHNPFYSSEKPKYDGTDKPLAAGATLCSWCGTWKGDKICGSCRKARYCSERHQTTHWKSGHWTECGQWTASQDIAECGSKTTSAAPPIVARNHVWPEFEIINEDESEYDTEMSDDNMNANSLVSRSKNDEMYTSMIDTFKGDADNRSWASFHVRISKAPNQVLRYLREPKAKPLLPMSSGRPSRADIPNCTHCGKPRSFEFQVLPQLLYYFGVENEENSLDWATIIAYTCDDSCEGGVAYKEEFAFVQLVTQSTTSVR
ncbi:hypothetical protein Leryth_018576 [Lithospermum erythrorhizon]|nr:hypothetical protein Leryth_018576 [Lithospermum erythrorhizon]